VVRRGITAEDKPEQAAIFATGLNRPFGVNFYPPGPDPQWICVGNRGLRPWPSSGTLVERRAQGRPAHAGGRKSR